MLKSFFKRNKPKVYLGCIAVVPRSDFKHHLEKLFTMAQEDLDSSLKQTLENIFDLPAATECENPKNNDLALDIIIPSFQTGEILNANLGEIAFPIIWRPKIEIAARLYSLKTGKTVHSNTVKVKMPWREYFARLLTWKAFFQMRSLFDSKDMNQLLALACMKLLKKLNTFS